MNEPMKKKLKYVWLIPLAAMAFPLSSCTTDAYGNTSVSPGGAVAIGVGALAAGAIAGAAIQNNHDRKHHYDDRYHDHHHHNDHYRHDYRHYHR
jgi:hypothetical protein